MKRVSWLFRLCLIVIAGALMITATTVAAAPHLWRVANAHEERPVELPDFSAVSQRSIVYDAKGNQIASYELENSQPLHIEDIPQHAIDAFLAVEDSEYYEHNGVNVRGLFRASLSNFADGTAQGASTITMQVVKNDYLAGLPRDGRYKLVQIAYSVRLEKHKTKDQILERYLNTVFFGENSYGIGAAAETYFGKPATELTLIEAAFLAGLVRAPSSFDPITQPVQSRTRFNQVLARLVDVGLLTEAEREEANRTFVLPERVRRREERTSTKTHYTEAIRDYLLNRTDILGDTYDERYTRLHRGGLRIYTTIDPDLQKIAEQARTVLPQNSAGIDAAMTTIENSTGAIRAMVGGAPFERGRNELNLALAPSQTGSSIKLFVLAAAIQAGAEGKDLIDGTRGCRFATDDPKKPFQLTSGLARDTVSDLYVQTANSVNCAYIRLSMIVGLNRVVDTVYRMSDSPYLYRGQNDRRPLDTFQSFAIGANEMSTLDMASGMQTIANVGIHIRPYFVDKIDDAEGNRVYTHETEGVRVFDQDAALTTIDILRGPPARGTARHELAEMAARRPIIGKTGTQDSNTTAWFVGATPELSTAVLVRDPDRYTKMRNIPEFKELWTGADAVQGGTYPAMIWKALMDQTGLETVSAGWPGPPEPKRPPARLYLPGNECVVRFQGYRNVASAVEVAPTPDGFTSAGVTENAQPPGTEPATPQATAAPQTTSAPKPKSKERTVTTPVTTPAPTPAPPPAPPSAAPQGTVQTTIVTRRQPVYSSGNVGTTVPPEVLDPNAPMPSLPLGDSVRPC